ncbi:MAG: hypothetical protein AAF657_41745, partial [Acidobacteriota bacterium]
MKIRTQLIVALLLLAVLPLTGLVAYNYLSSRRAVRQTVEAEAAVMTAEMESRLTSVKQDLQSRMAQLDGLSFTEWDTFSDPGDTQPTPEKALVRRWLTELGDAAPLVESFEVIPAPPAPPQPEGAPAAPSPVAPVAPTRAEIESIVLEVTRQVEEFHGDIVEIGIAEGIEHGLDVAVAMVEAFAPLAEGDVEDVRFEESETSEETEVSQETEADDATPTLRWLMRLRDASETAELAKRVEERQRH